MYDATADNGRGDKAEYLFYVGSAAALVDRSMLVARAGVVQRSVATVISKSRPSQRCASSQKNVKRALRSGGN